ncbi:MAG TPA: family 10 glycosylhydrolase [Armatimonadota bacterium]|nr:family 10 glycosylhydrolase [Armatimonadota bacterium]
MFFKYALTLLPIFLMALGTSAVAQEKPEFRAMWVSSYGPNADMVTPQGIDQLIADAKRANLNALLVQVRKTGDALYDSSYEPRAENLTLPDFDPLAYVIEKAHAQGLEVHAWINTYKIWADGPPPKNPNHAFSKHPEWVNKNNKGQRDKSRQYALDPGAKPVQDYLYNVYMEVVKKYDVDGIHFDYVRYWDPTFGYSDLAVWRYKQETGSKTTPTPSDPKWCQWRRDQVTALVRRVYEGAKETKPWVKVTASVVCSQPCPQDFKKSHPYNMLLQDWESWLKEGIVDAVMPMNYKSETDPKAAKLFRDWIEGMVRWRHGRHVYNGILISGAHNLIVQITASRKRGADGVLGFAFNRSDSRGRLADSLKDTVFAKWAPVPDMPWKPKRESGSLAKPEGPQELFDKAISYASNDKGLDKAIDLLKSAIQQDENFTEAHFRLGRCYLRKGMKAEAEAEFKETLQLDAVHAGAQAELEKIGK